MKANKTINVVSFLSILISLYFIVILKYEIATNNIVNQDSLNYEITEYAITNESCSVKLKPDTNSITLKILPNDYSIVILDRYYKWYYIRYLNNDDSLLESGWIERDSDLTMY